MCIYNYIGLGIVEKQLLVYCIWLILDKGYNVCYLLKYWENLRRFCFFIEFGDVRENLINFLINLIDFVSFFSLVVNKLMKFIE